MIISLPLLLQLHSISDYQSRSRYRDMEKKERVRKCEVNAFDSLEYRSSFEYDSQGS